MTDQERQADDKPKDKPPEPETTKPVPKPDRDTSFDQFWQDTGGEG